MLVELFRSSPWFEVAGEAVNGADAIHKAIALKPDLIVMDVHMPVVGGVDATKEIMRDAPTPIMMVSASSSVSNVSAGLSATQAGALVLLEKPRNPGSGGTAAEGARFLSIARAMAGVKVVRRWGTGVAMSRGPRRLSETIPRTVPRLIAIGASTGGPAALHKILLDLPVDLGIPLVVVQHMAHGFIGGLAAWLGANVGVRVTVAAGGETLIGGAVYIAPDDRHLGVSTTGRVVLSDSPTLSGFRPSADYLFDSCARSYGADLVAVVLTGMGQDGVAGLQTVRERGGRILAQDEKSSVVFGMAQQAIKSGVVDEILPLDLIGRRLVALIEEQPA